MFSYYIRCSVMRGVPPAMPGMISISLALIRTPEHQGMPEISFANRSILSPRHVGLNIANGPGDQTASSYAIKRIPVAVQQVAWWRQCSQQLERHLGPPRLMDHPSQSISSKRFSSRFWRTCVWIVDPPVHGQVDSRRQTLYRADRHADVEHRVGDLEAGRLHRAGQHDGFLRDTAEAQRRLDHRVGAVRNENPLARVCQNRRRSDCRSSSVMSKLFLLKTDSTV